MAVKPATFTGFDPYKLTGVTVTDRKLGHGSYATVLELEYMGLKCAGKKIHELLLEQGDASYTVCRFEKECRLLSEVRHPNIVQFLGVYFQQGVRAPILVMEFLPTNLTSCIEQYGILSKEISYSILRDVALGLRYLHSQTPPIIHRDLSSNNVLLTPNMTAKISDLGVASIFKKLTPLQVSRMTQTPGTPAFMPPEVMVANPNYGTSVDMFSYGIMMIHMLSGQWPEPQVGPSRTEGGELISITEAERREEYFEAINDGHPLKEFAQRCINNDPQLRPHAGDIIGRVSRVRTPFPANQLEMLRQIEQLKLKYSSEIEQLQLKLRDMNTQRQLTNDETKAEKTELESNIRTLENQVQTLLQEPTRQMTEAQEQYRIQLERERETYEVQLTSEREANSILKFEITNVNSKLQSEKIGKDSTIQEMDASIQRKDSELEAKSRALKEKDETISELNKQITKAREYLATSKLQALQVSITWKPCANLPVKLNGGLTTVINGKVYCGGGKTCNTEDAYIVYCYDPSQDNWTTLPPLPVNCFGLGQVNGKPVAVGGCKNRATNDVYMYDEQSQIWEQTIPPMPTARWSPDVLSLQSALVVAGGCISLISSTFTAAVEIFKPGTSQWYKADALPTACSHISLGLVAINNTCYALGGYCSGSNLTQALHASVDDLLGNAVPANQTTNSGSSDTHDQSAWKTLPNTPTYQPAAAVLAGHLLAIGGKEISGGDAAKKEVYMYSPSANSWVYINDLPAPRSATAAADLSSTEVLVIGGWDDDGIMDTVYKGTLTLQ